MHDNCKGWKKACPCSCRRHKPYQSHDIKLSKPLFPASLRKLPEMPSADTGRRLERIWVGELSYEGRQGPLGEGLALLRNPAKLPARQKSGFKVALVAINHGPLPAYVNYFIALTRINAPLVEHFIFHTHRENSYLDLELVASVPSVHLVYMPLDEIARRLEELGVCPKDTDGMPLTTVLKKQSSGGYGSKMNDLKPTFGGLFARELAGYSHWGWVDLDCMMGDLRPSLADYLPDFDVITYPDGGLNALFTAGQLTVFRNVQWLTNEFFKV